MKLKDKLANRFGYLTKDQYKADLNKVRAKTIHDLTRTINMAKVDRLTNDWLTQAKTLNADLRSSLSTMIARARDIATNDPYAKKFIRLVSKNLIGPDGFTLRNKAGDYRDGKFTLDKLANRIIQDAWWEWGKPQFATVTGNTSFREFCRMAAQSCAIDGEVFIRILKGKNVNDYGITLQLIEADYVDEKMNYVLDNGNFIMMGIEVTPYRKPIAYHFKKVILDRELYTSRTAYEYERVPADQVIHLFYREMPSQVRGLTWLAPSAIRLKMLMGYEEAALINARASADKHMVVQRKDSMSGEFTGQDKDADGNVVQDLEPGEVYQLPFGWEMASWDPKYPDAQHDAFAKINLMGISSGLDVSYHSLSSNVSDVNYTSSRTALLDERDTWKTMQAWFIETFVAPVFTQWLDMSMLTEMINLPYTKFEKFNQPFFYGRRWDWVDPQNEVQANILAHDNLHKPLAVILAERGMDLEETLEEFQLEKELLAKYDVQIVKKESAQQKPSNGNGKSNGKAKEYHLNGARL